MTNVIKLVKTKKPRKTPQLQRLYEAVELAQANKAKAVAVVVVDKEGTVSTGWSHSEGHYFPLLGGVEQLRHNLITSTTE